MVVWLVFLKFKLFLFKFKKDDEEVLAEVMVVVLVFCLCCFEVMWVVGEVFYVCFIV